ncbi:hypothetical protein GCM10023188_15790 [Pontibacter saemangeumensis]|uniref:Conjugal transfer protein TraI n=1 Tax=Pontibacter saemangeumensis TaxID=1084525 RepID=A0ABP8LJD2_9BACT
MKKICMLLVIAVMGAIAPIARTQAQTPVLEVIKAGIKKAIKAVDLQVQRQQNKVIWLQNAQKNLENAMSQLQLGEISGWMEKQRTLYQEYYGELYRVKTTVSDYHRIRDIMQKQVHLVEEYQQAWRLFRQDRHFSREELNHMAQVYAGILEESAKNIDRIFLVVQAFATQMSDSKRLEIIDAAADQVDASYNDLRMFNRQNILLSLQRAKTQRDVEAVRKLYGLL